MPTEIDNKQIINTTCAKPSLPSSAVLSTELQTETATIGQTEITLNRSSTQIDVFVDGIYQIPNVDYTLASNIIAFTDPLFEGSIINIRIY